jgi:basic amino acid/polyamine antiporter, APA family
VAEEIAFARKASGLTRGLSMTDTFSMGLMFTQPIYAIWFVFMVGLGIFHAGNMLIALAISLVIAGISAPLVWGILGGTMPRSGGDYVFNSRVISPAVAIAASCAGVAGGMYATVWVATWMVHPSLAILAGYLNSPGLERFAASKWATIVLGFAALAIGFAFVSFGMQFFKKAQRVFVVVGIAGPVVLMITLLATSKGRFIGNWDRLAAQHHSLTYHAFIGAMGKAAGPMPTTWNWHDTFGLMSAMSGFFIYTFIIGYVAGEVKRPDRSLLFAGWLSSGVVFVIGALTFIGLYHVADFQFLSAAATNNLWGGIKGYNFPFDSSYMSIAWVASGGNAIIAWVAALTFFLTTLWVIVVTFMIPGRQFFAWGMDRMGPKWFTSISARYAAPVYNYLIFFVVCSVALVAYVLWFTNAYAGLTTIAMQLISTFMLTGLSAIVIAYRPKTSTIWSASPYRTWKLGGVPIVTLAGLVYCAYICALLYFAFFDPETRDVTGKNVIFLIAAWTVGIVWYVVWKTVATRSGVDTSLTYGQLPPE